jgi:hypothetical protein
MSIQIKELERKYELSKNVFKPNKDKNATPEFIRVFATVSSSGKLSVTTHKGNNFIFQHSEPLVVLAVAELLMEAAALGANVGAEEDKENKGYDRAADEQLDN